MRKTHVYTPSPIAFLCGGKIDATAVGAAPSFRDLFLRFEAVGNFSGRRYIVAEQLNAFFPRGKYEDILSFERDLAEISELIIVFSESYGSVAELGAFSILDEISDNLLIFIDDKNYNETSFIRLGPLKFLENTQGSQAVSVLDREYLEIPSIQNLTNINNDRFKNIVKESIDIRIESIPSSLKFNRKNNGHIIKLVVGIIQIYAALTFEEIFNILSDMNISCRKKELENFLLCAEFAEWITRRKQGTRVLFLPLVMRRAVSFTFKSKYSNIPKIKYDALIREAWKKVDGLRFDVISSSMQAIKE